MVFYSKCDIKNNFLKIFYPSLIERRGGGLLPTLPPSDEPSFQESLHMQPNWTKSSFPLSPKVPKCHGRRGRIRVNSKTYSSFVASQFVSWFYSLLSVYIRVKWENKHYLNVVLFFITLVTKEDKLNYLRCFVNNFYWIYLLAFGCPQIVGLLQADGCNRPDCRLVLGSTNHLSMSVFYQWPIYVCILLMASVCLYFNYGLCMPVFY